MIPLTVNKRNLNYFQFGWYSNILDDLWTGKRVPMVSDAKVNAADVNHIINPEKISSSLTDDQSATMSGFKWAMLDSKVQRRYRIDLRHAAESTIYILFHHQHNTPTKHRICECLLISMEANQKHHWGSTEGDRLSWHLKAEWGIHAFGRGQCH